MSKKGNVISLYPFNLAKGLNLPQEQNRLNFSLQSLREFPLEIHRFEAISGDTALKGKNPPFSSLMRRPLLGGEYGCLLSHLEVLKLISQQASPFSIVFEDDIVPSKYFGPLLETLKSTFGDKASEINIPWDILHLQCVRKDGVLMEKGTTQNYGNITFGRLLSPMVGCAGLVITKQAALKILDKRNLCMPIDELLFNKYSPLFQNLRTYQSTKPLIFVLDDFKKNNPISRPTTIGDRRSLKRHFSLLNKFQRLKAKLSYSWWLFNKEKVFTKFDYSEENELKRETLERMRSFKG